MQKRNILIHHKTHTENEKDLPFLGRILWLEEEGVGLHAIQYLALHGQSDLLFVANIVTFLKFMEATGVFDSIPKEDCPPKKSTAKENHPELSYTVISHISQGEDFSTAEICKLVLPFRTNAFSDVFYNSSRPK